MKYIQLKKQRLLHVQLHLIQYQSINATEDALIKCRNKNNVVDNNFYYDVIISLLYDLPLILSFCYCWDFMHVSG